MTEGADDPFRYRLSSPLRYRLPSPRRLLLVGQLAPGRSRAVRRADRPRVRRDFSIARLLRPPAPRRTVPVDVPFLRHLLLGLFFHAFPGALDAVASNLLAVRRHHSRYRGV